jgi:hypothetical protein
MGMVASTIANANRDASKKPDPFTPKDFIPWGRERERESAEPISLDDEKSQSDLIRAAMFGLSPAP